MQPSEAPLALVGRHGRRRVVVAADATARAAGIRVGMSATMAGALVAGLDVRDAEPAADAAALDRLAVWAHRRYAPVVAADRPDGIVIDSTGADHLHGGEEAMLADMVDRLTGFGITTRAAVADTWGAAHALARYAARPAFAAAPGSSAAVIAPLPVAALRLSADLAADLRLLGFERVADLLALERGPLALRFGPEVGRRLDQALGRIAEPIVSLRPPGRIEVRRDFVEPIGAAETIARWIDELVVRLCRVLATRGLGVRRLDLDCRKVDGSAQVVRVGTASPVRDAKRLTRLLGDKIETIDPGFGIEEMTLGASIVEPLPEKQIATALVEAPAPDVSSLIDTLANRVGARRLYRVAPVASDVPERSVRRVSPLAPETEKTTWPGRWPRPARLLAPPEPIETVALLPDHPPVSFTWRGTRRRVRRADGPERVFGEWWKRDPELCAVRDYFRVEDDAGERYWIFRSGDGEDGATGSQRWFLHGIFA